MVALKRLRVYLVVKRRNQIQVTISSSQSPNPLQIMNCFWKAAINLRSNKTWLTPWGCSEFLSVPFGGSTCITLHVSLGAACCPDPPGDKDKRYATSLDLQMLVCKTHSSFWIRGWGPPLQCRESFSRGRSKAGTGFSLRHLTERWHWNLKRKDSTRSSCDHREREGWGLAVDTVERRATSRKVVLKVLGLWTPLHS